MWYTKNLTEIVLTFISASAFGYTLPKSVLADFLSLQHIFHKDLDISVQQLKPIFVCFAIFVKTGGNWLILGTYFSKSTWNHYFQRATPLGILLVIMYTEGISLS